MSEFMTIGEFIAKQEAGELPEIEPYYIKAKRRTFTVDEKADMVKRIDGGEPIKSVAISYKVSHNTIWRIYNRIT
jgi:DNA invertase Pin-like site-specific DNA recombinase